MPSKALTDAIVAEAEPPAAGRLELWDAELPGFGLRITPAGQRSWQVMYRIDGRKRRLTLGSFPALPLKFARDAARATLKEVAKGNDPAAQRASLRSGALTFARFAEAYIERYAKREKRTWQADARMIEADLLPAWGPRAIDDIRRRDVIEMVERVCARGHPYAANRRLALLRKMFAWGVEVDMVPATPVVGVTPPGREARRQRVLDEAEIAALWRAWNNMAWPFGPLFKLLLLTGQRRNQVASLRLADIGFAQQIWTVPEESGRPGSGHEIPLSTFALEIATSVPRTASDYVFPARGQPDRHASGFSKAAQRASRLSGVADWRTEDLRRTMADGMVRLGTPAPVVRNILDRAARTTVGGVEVGDDRSAFEDMRAALEAWGERVREIAGTTASEGPPETT
ncbi:MAG: integrase arm-type DNA-binding domain-containing protein [Kiloniellales bacterium]|nr:integrase arm-type DNA-binding domain-containing protein [Kiloniellales bacterium]